LHDPIIRCISRADCGEAATRELGSNPRHLAEVTRSTEQWIKNDKQAEIMTQLSCHRELRTGGVWKKAPVKAVGCTLDGIERAKMEIHDRE